MTFYDPGIGGYGTQPPVVLQSDDARLRHEVDSLRMKVERLSLACEAMWTLLSERLGVSGEELAVRIREIDVSDGTLDNHHTQLARRCPRCDAAVSPDSPKCQFCGAEAPATGPFAM